MTDILGDAIMDYYNYERSHILWVHDHYGPKVEMPVSTYFRNEKDMPELELKALSLCKGMILDIGAGAGSHALALEDREMDVTAIDISPQLVSVMEMRGVTKFIQGDILKYNGAQYDTLLLLMNGIGLVQNISGLRAFLQHAKTLLKPQGQLLFDSSDVAYLYEDDIPVMDGYYGEVECRYEYRKKKSAWFSWLYIDRHTLQLIAADEGWSVEIIMEDDSEQYLVRMTQSHH